MRIFYVFAFVVLASCSSHDVSSYKDEAPKINLREFFNGDIEALGIVQDRSGKVIKRFHVEIKASWRDKKATLDERFVYSDGTKSSRVWELNETSPGRFSGYAGDVIGEAKGETSGNVFYFEYILNLPVGDNSYKVKFEDWMYLLDNKTLLARSYMSKWGFNLGEVTIVMSKKDSRP